MAAVLCENPLNKWSSWSPELKCDCGCTKSELKIDKKYYLVSEAYDVARSLFLEGRTSYNQLKNTSRLVMDTFLDLVHIMNSEMAKKLRGAVIKFYKIKYFHDFTNYVITLEEMIDITEHCLSEPAEKLEQLRRDFHSLIRNFQDIRLFHTVHKCHNELPDEVASAHCILHQAVLFNETMQDSLVSIVEIKMNQHARKMNETLYEVPRCLNAFVPNFYEQLLVDAYTEQCGFLKVVNASIEDLMKDRWRGCNDTLLFPKKWTPLVEILKQKYDRMLATCVDPPLYTTSLTMKEYIVRKTTDVDSITPEDLRKMLRYRSEKSMTSQSLLLTLLSANLTSNDIIKTLYP